MKQFTLILYSFKWLVDWYPYMFVSIFVFILDWFRETLKLFQRQFTFSIIAKKNTKFINNLTFFFIIQWFFFFKRKQMTSSLKWLFLLSPKYEQSIITYIYVPKMIHSRKFVETTLISFDDCFHLSIQSKFFFFKSISIAIIHCRRFRYGGYQRGIWLKNRDDSMTFSTAIYIIKGSCEARRTKLIVYLVALGDTHVCLLFIHFN